MNEMSHWAGRDYQTPKNSNNFSKLKCVSTPSSQNHPSNQNFIFWNSHYIQSIEYVVKKAFFSKNLIRKISTHFPKELVQAIIKLINIVLDSSKLGIIFLSLFQQRFSIISIFCSSTLSILTGFFKKFTFTKKFLPSKLYLKTKRCNIFFRISSLTLTCQMWNWINFSNKIELKE